VNPITITPVPVQSRLPNPDTNVLLLLDDGTSCEGFLDGMENGAPVFRDVCADQLDRDLVVAWADMPVATQEVTKGLRDLMAERRRQVTEEGWSAEHDDAHQTGELAQAAATYALFDNKLAPFIWPWAPEWWKPKDRRNNLVRAGALILAEIERLDRGE
jgi:hypothetical protein